MNYETRGKREKARYTRERLRPILEKIKAWLDEKGPKALPKAKTPEEIAALLPMNLKPEDLSTEPIDLPRESQAL